MLLVCYLLLKSVRFEKRELLKSTRLYTLRLLKAGDSLCNWEKHLLLGESSKTRPYIIYITYVTIPESIASVFTNLAH
jgi:hypothetical protein